ncbi:MULTISPECIES: dioxygenase [Halocynthiibacter]|uniref:Hydroxyquinol 1,2-dioxygenase n=1 Tax=Halocynthiibacter halioticoli TaxID=2986804 RepID=A0AAE3LTB1_9RHOB|nr:MULTISPECIES: dioxygenase [Halocynthiibacter]MCV6824831.1 hydroxyquinol 1,2-dioxygenase [Halocynthiibacter halioticoli]MCW4057832.1 hydroxyquinol 1,2-dioxygenase [Halocynthiibacter sp. SDUM655004]
MKNVTIDTITQAFVDYCSDDTDPRTMFLLTKLVEHLHAFAIETQLTHAEWSRALKFATDAGKITDNERNEFVLISDVTGLSSLVDMIGSQHEGTSSSVLGPFHSVGAPLLPVGGDLKKDNEGATVVVEGYVRDLDGNPVEGALIELWQTAENGLYYAQDNTQDDFNLCCSMKTGADGRYALTTVKPAPYKVPDDGPVGELFRATGRTPWRPSHLHFIVQADGLKPLVTEVFANGDPYLDSDAVFGVRSDLIMDYVECSDLDALPDDLEIGRNATVPYFKVDFDFVLVPENS